MNIKIHLIILISVFSNLIIAQSRKLPYARNENLLIKNKNYKPISFSKRLDKFPFSKATKIKLVSFNLEFGENDEIQVTPIGEPDVIQEKPIDFRKYLSENNLESFAQVKTLNLSQINKLTDILYNDCSKYIISNYSTLGCYYPRNAIIFYDENDKIFQYIEICFECQQVETKPIDLNDFHEFCKVGLSDLQSFFDSNGINTRRTRNK